MQLVSYYSYWRKGIPKTKDELGLLCEIMLQ